MPSTDKIKDRLEKLDLEKAELKGQLDRDRLMAATNTVIETITSPEFVEKMRLCADCPIRTIGSTHSLRCYPAGCG